MKNTPKSNKFRLRFCLHPKDGQSYLALCTTLSVDRTVGLIKSLSVLSQGLPEPYNGYEYYVDWDEQDACYIAGFDGSRVAHGDTPEEAVKELFEAVRGQVGVDGESVPESKY